MSNLNPKDLDLKEPGTFTAPRYYILSLNVFRHHTHGKGLHCQFITYDSLSFISLSSLEVIIWIKKIAEIDNKH